MRCLVTGASGFLGSWLVRQLIAEGHSVTVCMRTCTPSRINADWLGRVDIIQGSFDDLGGLRRCIEPHSIDCVFHLAWFGVTADFRNHADQISTNVIGSLRLWEIARDLGCKHWIGIGSQAEYGPCKGALREDFPANPVTAYGVAKLAIGSLTRKMAEMSGMRHTWVRLLAAYGPGDDYRHLIPSVIRELTSGHKPALTNGDQLWDYLYVTDAVNALCRIAETEATGLFNLASGKVIEVRKLIEGIRDLIEPKLALGFGEIAYRPDQVMRLEADISKLRAATGWQPETSLEDGIRRTIEWFRADSVKYDSFMTL